MVEDLLTNIGPLAPISLYYLGGDGAEGTPTGPEQGPFPALPPDRLRRQRGADLGERMSSAFAEVFVRTGTDRVLLIGSDIPHITADLLEDYFSKLDEHDVVLGPAEDGGYYLVGLHRTSFTPALFEDIPWSTGRVRRETVRRAEKLGLSVYLGPTLRDIDTLEDLEVVLRRSARILPSLARFASTGAFFSSSAVGSTAAAPS